MARSIVLTLTALAVLQATPLLAQDPPKVEFFVGYSRLGLDVQANGTRTYFSGLGLNVEGNLNNKWGIVGDFATQGVKIGAAPIRLYQYSVGPRYNWRKESVNVFGQTHFGGFHLAGGGQFVYGIMLAFGGGVDVKLNDIFSARVVQLDFIPWKSQFWNNNAWEKDLRLQFGIVIKDSGN